MSHSTGSSEEDEAYAFVPSGHEQRKYPVHDCCEFEDAEALRRLLFVPKESTVVTGEGEDEKDDSSSDDNDSAAAAHAAAIGHSPQPLAAKPVDPVTTNQATSEDPKQANGEDSGEADGDAMETEGPAEIINGKPSSEPAPSTPMETPSKTVEYYCPYNVNERDNDENTPIHVAIHARKLDHVKLLLEAGASVHKKSDGSAPIHAAISIGSIPKHAQFAYQCVELLYSYEADLGAKDDAVHTPLFLACMYNLPQVVQFILSKEEGLSTLNIRADRSGRRALHAAAKFETPSHAKIGRVSSVSHLKAAEQNHHHPDGTVVNALHTIPSFEASTVADGGSTSVASEAPTPLHPRSLLTEVLLETSEIEVDAPDSMGQTPLHIACGRGNFNVARLLLQAGANPTALDKRGLTPGNVAHKRGMVIPVDLIEALGGPPQNGTVPPARDLIVDPHSSTLVLSHELCTLHRTCPPMIRDADDEFPPENVRRLTVLVDPETGILRTGEFSSCSLYSETRRAAMSDVLKCHEYDYVEKISSICSSLPDHPQAIGQLDADTAISRWSFEAALRAAGSVCDAVDKVVSGDYRNAFCPVRPPGHHAGPRGIVRCENDRDGGSHGFCLLNNVAIGAAYARSMYRNEGIRKVAIVDFDVHHGNGTEEIIRQLLPGVDRASISAPFAIGELVSTRYRPWLDETDVNNVFFASTHGYGPRGIEFADTPIGGWFYPASGKTGTSDAIRNPSMVESPNLGDFLLSQTWARMGDDARSNCCKIMNCGLGLPQPDAVPGIQRLEVRDTYRKKILPRLREFDPDIIFISAGFDAHKKDTMNFGYVGMVEDDYEWVTEQLVKIANTCCNGRIVSVLEGGYKIHGGIVSPFARSVASHVRALCDGGRSRELYDAADGEWESRFEANIVEEREKKRQQKNEKLRMIAEQTQMLMGGGEDDAHSTRKRKRNQVDYRALYEQMKAEGFAG